MDLGRYRELHHGLQTLLAECEMTAIRKQSAIPTFRIQRIGPTLHARGLERMEPSRRRQAVRPMSVTSSPPGATWRTRYPVSCHDFAGRCFARHAVSNGAGAGPLIRLPQHRLQSLDAVVGQVSSDCEEYEGEQPGSHGNPEAEDRAIPEILSIVSCREDDGQHGVASCRLWMSRLTASVLREAAASTCVYL
jgi:hypothetical protein